MPKLLAEQRANIGVDMITVGAEIEIPGAHRVTIEEIRKWLRCEPHDDGSIRGTTFAYKGISLMMSDADASNVSASVRGLEIENYGFELVTEPYPYEEMLQHLQRLAKLFGHIAPQPRASVHFHLDVAGKPWRMVQRMIEWYYYLEAPLYRLAGCGGLQRGCLQHKGEYTDHRYARPLSNSIGVMWGDDLRHLVNIKAMLDAKNASEFLSHWGRLDYYYANKLGRYVPHRLMGINLSSVVRQGTIEVRLNNGVYSMMADMVRVIYRIYDLADRGIKIPYDKPMLLGMKPQISSDDIATLMGFEVAHMWGKDWPQGVRTDARESHYARMSVPTITRIPTIRIEVGGVRDDYSDEFPIYAPRDGQMIAYKPAPAGWDAVLDR